MKLYLTQFFGLLISPSNAETLNIEWLVPDDLSLRIEDLYDITAAKESPATVEVRNAKLIGRTDKFQKLQVVVIEQNYFDTKLSKDNFCCLDGAGDKDSCENDFQLVGAKSNSDVGPIFSVPILDNPTVKISTSGKYYVGLLNCQEETQVKDNRPEVSASVILKSSHGYLLSLERLYFDTVLVVIYGFSLIGWLYICKKHQEGLVTTHYSIGVLLLACFLADFVELCKLKFENEQGNEAVIVVVFASASRFMEVLRFGVALFGAVMIGLGYGTSHDSLNTKDMAWLMGYIFLWCCFASVRSLFEYSSSLMHRPLSDIFEGFRPKTALESADASSLDALKEKALLSLGGVTVGNLSVLPEAMIFGTVANWAWTSLNDNKSFLNTQKQFESLKTLNSFDSLIRILVALLFADVVAHVFLNGDYGFIQEKVLMLVPEGILLLGVLGTAWMFFPSEHFKVKAQSMQISMEDAELDEINFNEGEIELVHTSELDHVKEYNNRE